jgi:type VI protein secretion system component Hcp
VERVEFAFTKVEVDYRRQEGSGQAGATSSFMDEVLAQ